MRILNKIIGIVKAIIRLPKQVFFFTIYGFSKGKLVFYVIAFGTQLFLRSLIELPIVGIIMKPFLIVPERAIYIFLSRRKASDSGISCLSLIDLGVHNIRFKKTRSFITIGGMAIGIGSIVFLVSLGYGAQRMVVNRVARLDELKQTDIATQPGSRVQINDQQLARMKQFKDVVAALPLISVVGRVNYKNSVTDMAVYGVTTQYLAESAEKPVKGSLFSSNELNTRIPDRPDEGGSIAGVTAERMRGKKGDEIGKINYSVQPDKWIRIRKTPEPAGEEMGFARRAEGQSVGTLVLGSSYPDNPFGSVEAYDRDADDTITLGKWIKNSYSLWEPIECDPVNVDCDPSGKYRRKKAVDGKPLEAEGYSAIINVSIYDLPITQKNATGQVLGLEAGAVETISIDDIKATGAAQLLVAEIASESAQATAKIRQVEVAAAAKKQAVVNRAMLSVLNIKEPEAIGKEFTVSFIVSGDLLGQDTGKIESIPTQYKIIGVVPQTNTPFFYVPFIDLRTLGISNFSQVKVIAKTPAVLGLIRRQIEGLGFATSSASDTVEQIDRLFATVRMVLVSLGIVALGVAAMGMFNTLTVSLLERTHEVGLMKTMGMKSNEVEDLFLIESVVMGLFGGVAGILFGFGAGKILSLILTIFALRSGAGIIDISYVPFALIMGVMALSLVVGLITGIYPAYRARHISALNALRYE